MRKIVTAVIILGIANWAYSQNFGIDVASPLEKLHVNGNVQVDNNVHIEERLSFGFRHVSRYPTPTGFTLGFNSSDWVSFIPVYVGSTSDLRLYIEDDADDSFSIWGGSCAGGGCNNIANSTQLAKFSYAGGAQFTCRSGFWTVADGRVCIEMAIRGPNNMHEAIGICRGVAPGCRVCEHNDMQQGCGAGINPYSGSTTGWYGDHGVASGGNWDDEFGAWNRDFCDVNNDGPAQHATGVSYHFRCCY